jgi:hypothetical protein
MKIESIRMGKKYHVNIIYMPGVAMVVQYQVSRLHRKYTDKTKGKKGTLHNEKIITSFPAYPKTQWP